VDIVRLTHSLYFDLKVFLTQLFNSTGLFFRVQIDNFEDSFGVNYVNAFHDVLILTLFAAAEELATGCEAHSLNTIPDWFQEASLEAAEHSNLK